MFDFKKYLDPIRKTILKKGILRDGPLEEDKVDIRPESFIDERMESFPERMNQQIGLSIT